MSEPNTEIETSPPPEEIKGTPFSLDVNIKNLSYKFTGIIPNEPVKFLEWQIHLPKKYWDETKQKMKKLAYQVFDKEHLREMEKNEGTIGNLYMNVDDNSIILQDLRSTTQLLPKDDIYFDASGIGTFLLDNALAFSDYKKIPSFLLPLGRGEGRRFFDLVSWYEKKGFKYEETRRLRPQGSNATMMREPQEPDLNQPIIQVLQHQSH